MRRMPVISWPSPVFSPLQWQTPSVTNPLIAHRCSAHRSSDPCHDLLHQRLAARRHRRRQGHLSRNLGPVNTRGGGQCSASDRRTDDLNAFEVAGRGELQLAVLIEICAGRALNSLSAGRVLSIKKILRPSSAWSPSRRSSSTSMKSILERWWKTLSP